ncbi:MAG: hypothetical protein WAM92_22600 [Mycobacterium sp.]
MAAAIAAVGIGVAPSASADPYDVLWKMVPPGYSEGSCQAAGPGDTLEPGAIAYVECHNNSLPGGPSVARYVLFSDVNALNSHFADIYYHSPMHFKAVACPGRPADATRWAGPGNNSGGSVGCGDTEGDMAVVSWTNDSGPLVAWAEGPDLNALYGWWSTVIGG